MYVYLPAYNKVRRVASHANEQGFMGTTFSNSEMSITHYGAVYSGEVKAENDETWTVSAQPKPDAKSPYTRVEIDITKDRFLPLELRYFNDKDQKIKTESRPDYTCEGDICTPKVIKMVDHTRNDTWTEMVMQEWKTNNDYSDDLFSVRTLQRGG